jgi:hypothetical protein
MHSKNTDLLETRNARQAATSVLAKVVKELTGSMPCEQVTGVGRRLGGDGMKWIWTIGDEVKMDYRFSMPEKLDLTCQMIENSAGHFKTLLNGVFKKQGSLAAVSKV